MSNWEKQITDHCTPGTLSFCIYYGSSRSLSQEELVKFDVVITTYQTVTGEHSTSGSSDPSKKKKKKVERSLFDVQWKVNHAILTVNLFQDSPLF
jgi:SWI/SNF-related matrix-associated actin-dependent regulator of chromatin subfamily A3